MSALGLRYGADNTNTQDLWVPPDPGMAIAVSPPDAALLLVGAIACVTDIRSRRIPNVLTFGSSAAAVVFWGVSSGWAGLAWSACGWVVGCVLFLPWFLLGGMGAGDVKLLAALGAWRSGQRRLDRPLCRDRWRRACPDRLALSGISGEMLEMSGDCCSGASWGCSPTPI